MATGLTSTYSIPFPLSTDPVNVHGDVEDLAQQVEDVLETKSDTLQSNTFTAANSFEVDSPDPAVFILQTGSGNAFEVASEVNDTSPFIITASGSVGINTNDTEGFVFRVVGVSKFDTIQANNLIFEGATDDEFETVLQAVDPTQDNFISLPNETTNLVGDSTADILTNKTISLSDNTISGSITDFNSALVGFNFATLEGTETLQNKTLDTPTITDADLVNPSFSGDIGSDIGLPSGAVIAFKGANNINTTSISIDDTTADNDIVFPASSGRVITTGNTNDLYPSQTGNEDRVLTTNGSNVFWGEGGSGTGGSTWIFETNTYQASPNEAIVADTSTASFTITLPSSPNLGDKVSIVDYSDSFATNPLTVEVPSESSAIIEGNTSLILNVKGATVVLVYIDSTKGWRII